LRFVSGAPFQWFEMVKDRRRIAYRIENTFAITPPGEVPLIIHLCVPLDLCGEQSYDATVTS
jgi:hypothetical protein